MNQTAPPPAYSIEAAAEIELPTEERKLASFRQLVRRLEISSLMALKLRKLEAYDIVVIADDSGSMRTKSFAALTVTDPFAPTKTRWDELKETVTIVTEIASALDEDGIDIFFLNRPPARNINSNNASTVLSTVFQDKPVGYTPLTRTLTQVLNEKWHGVATGDRKKLVVLIATDGQPTTDTGILDIDGLRNLLTTGRANPGEILVCFLVCTDDDNDIEYLNKWDNVIRDLDVVDDYHTERKQICRVQGEDFPFSRGDWVCKMLLGAIDPEIDALDERRIETGLDPSGHGNMNVGLNRRSLSTSSRRSQFAKGIYVMNRDLEISSGELDTIEERLAFARAVYSDADLYLLDDHLRVIDTQVSKH
ncbi:hypothetical protein HK100_010202 [Physocladia obscura]|uniref:VWFA domain-containing protein n=1 Tax=Physocladia obscura TaxID=109957 RepID=A0AAD5T4C8_9FUNG|nr:hypothetical protein HK100_010202 [Physocladia obscura]